jgi:hypothetical protein
MIMNYEGGGGTICVAISCPSIQCELTFQDINIHTVGISTVRRVCETEIENQQNRFRATWRLIYRYRTRDNIF